MDHDKVRTAQAAYIKKVLAIRKQSASSLAAESDIDPSTLTRFLNSKHHANNLSATTLSKIEDLTGVKAPLPTNMPTLSVPVGLLRVIGVAAAGTWLEADFMDDLAIETIPVPPLPKYAGRSQYALQISGNSINKKALDGTYAICVSNDDLGIDLPPEGKFVHIQRTRAGLVETSIKQVQYKNGIIKFCPLSNDPKHIECLELPSHEDDTLVEIKGIAIGWFTHED